MGARGSSSRGSGSSSIQMTLVRYKKGLGVQRCYIQHNTPPTPQAAVHLTLPWCLDAPYVDLQM